MSAHALHQDGPTDLQMIRGTRTVLDLLAGKWSVDVLYLLAGGTRRYSEVFYEVGEISKKTLTQTLRSLERDGLVARRVYAEVPAKGRVLAHRARLEPHQPADGDVRVGGREHAPRAPPSARGLTMRYACLFAIVLLIGGLGTYALPRATDAPRSESAVAPIAAIDLGGIFGSENEPDENEADENEGGRPAAQSNQRSGISIPVALLLIVLAALSGGYVAIRVRRLWLRVVGWGRGMWARL